MSEDSDKHSETVGDILKRIRKTHDKRGNCTIALRTELWLRLGGEGMDISPNNFHNALAQWLTNAGLVDKNKTEDVASVLYCLGVINSNNLFQKIHQGKLESMGIGKNGRRNSKSRQKLK